MAEKAPGSDERRERRRPRLPRIGAHISTAGGLGAVPARAALLGAEVVQVFSSNPRTWRTDPPDIEGLGRLAAGLGEHGLPLFLHTIYLINLASPDDLLRERSGRALAHALVTGALAQAAGVVTHVGSHRGEGFKSAAGLVVGTIAAAVEEAQAALEAVAGTPPLHMALPPLLLETGAGAGATIGDRLEELAALLQASPVRVGLCLDTAHLFVSGYAIHLAEGLESLIADLRAKALLDRVGLVHLNDSATPFASRRDRHENPGDGQIGYRGLAGVVRHPALASIPFVLEVPGPDKHGAGVAEIALVKNMRRGAPARRPAPRGQAAPDPQGGPVRDA